MDIEKLIEQLKNLEACAYGYHINGEVLGMDCSDFEQVMVHAADEISKVPALQAENEKLRAELENYRKGHREEAISALSPPNEPLTQADLNEMYLNEVWLGYPDGSGETALVVSGKIYSTSSIEGAGLDLDEYIMGETLNNPTGNYKVYRRPPEGTEDGNV